MPSTISKDTVAESQKFVRFLKELIVDIANSSPECKHKLNQLMDSHINGFNEPHEGMFTRDFRASSLGKTIASFCKLVEAMDFVDEKGHITPESIQEGLEINADKDIYFLLHTNDIELRTLWNQGHRQTKKALTTYIKILYFYGHTIVERLRGYETFGELISGFAVVERDPYKDVNNARTYVNNIIDTVGTEKKVTEEAKGTANNIINDIVGILDRHGVKPDGGSIEDILLTANIDDIIEDAKKTVTSKLSTGEFSMDPLKNIYSAFMNKLSSEDGGDDMSQVLRGAIAKNNL